MSSAESSLALYILWAPSVLLDNVAVDDDDVDVMERKRYFMLMLSSPLMNPDPTSACRLVLLDPGPCLRKPLPSTFSLQMDDAHNLGRDSS